MFEEQRKPKSFIYGLITGGLIGGLAGLLLAPKCGKDLRKNISNRSRELMHDTDELLGNAKEKASEIISDAKQTTDSIIKESMKKVNSLAGGAANLVSEGKEQVEDSVSRVKEAIKSGSEAFMGELQNHNSDKNKDEDHGDHKNKHKKPR